MADLRVSISSNTAAYAPGSEADFVVTVANVGSASSVQTHLVIAVPSGADPARRAGCRPRLRLPWLADRRLLPRLHPERRHARTIFAVRVGSSGPQSVTATASSDQRRQTWPTTAPRRPFRSTPRRPHRPSRRPSSSSPCSGRRAGTPAGPSSGKRFTFKLPVRRSDTRALLTAGRLVVKTTLGGKTLTRTSSFKGGQVELSLLVPKRSAGKLLKITITVSSGSQSATKTFTYRVR